MSGCPMRTGLWRGFPRLGLEEPKSMPNNLLRCLGWAACLLALGHPAITRGQEKSILQGLNAEVFGGDPGGSRNPVSVKAEFYAKPGDRAGQLAITAELEEGWHTYSITQPPGGPIRTRIKLTESPDFRLTGDFKASPAPKSHVDKEIWKGLTLEEHYGRVTWTAPVEFAEGVDPTQAEISGAVNAQACEKSCLPPKDMPFTAHWAKPAAPIPVPATRPAAANSEVYAMPEATFHGRLEPEVASPGGKVKLVLTAAPTDGWHIYELGRPGGKTVSKPTLIGLTDAAGLEVGATTADLQPTHDADNPVGQHEKPVSWTTELTVPNGAKPGKYKLSGVLAYQICMNHGSCLRPTATGFEATLSVDFNSADGVVPVMFTGKTSYAEAVEALAGKEGQFNVEQIAAVGGPAAGQQPLWRMLGIAFLGGLILNLMPCVLPVIGLKILSFVEQSGRNRGHVFWLNV